MGQKKTRDGNDETRPTTRTRAPRGTGDFSRAFNETTLKIIMSLKKLCVFCGSSSGRDSTYVEEAKALGEYLASEKIQLTYGGGSIGLMGAIANAAYDEGQNRVLGIIPVGLCAREISGETVGEQIQTKDMHERKRLMAENSDGFVALP